MRITITARHCEIPDELRIRAWTLLERLTRLARRSHDGQVMFTADHGTPTVEVRVHAVRGAVHVGTAGGADHRTALDRAVAKVRRQLDKAPARRRGRGRGRGRRRGGARPRRALEREPR